MMDRWRQYQWSAIVIYWEKEFILKDVLNFDLKWSIWQIIIGCMSVFFTSLIQQKFKEQSYSCSTSYGWAKGNQVFLEGQFNYDYGGYKGEFQTGDVVELTLDCETKTLSFYTPQSGKTYNIKLPNAGPWRLHVNLYGVNDKIRLLDTIKVS